MIAKILLISSLIACAVGAAREWPAGVHPAICPDYPNCDPNILARFTPDGQPIPLWGSPYAAIAAPEVAPRYPADFNAALCPNYPYCW